jgi:hypothetical protein
MLLVFIGIFIALIIVGIIIGVKNCWDECIGGYISCFVLGIIGLLISVGIYCGGIVALQNIKYADAKIAVCKEENLRIEAQVEATVNHYLEYEQGIFDKIDISDYSGDRLLLISQLYPELKADTLLQKQLDLYVKNNEEIRELKLAKIDNEKWKFWLYFGG